MPRRLRALRGADPRAVRPLAPAWAPARRRLEQRARRRTRAARWPGGGPAWARSRPGCRRRSGRTPPCGPSAARSAPAP